MKLLALIFLFLLFSCEKAKPPHVNAELLHTDAKDSSPYDSKSLKVDPANIPETLLAPITITSKREQLQKSFERNLINHRVTKANWIQYSPIIFYYRDSSVAGLFREIIKDSAIHIYFRTLSVYALGECGFHDDFSFLLKYFFNDNTLFREYVACALNKLADSADRASIKALSDSERNGYITKSLQTGYHTKDYPLFRQLPTGEPSRLKQIAFYPGIWFSKMKMDAVADSIREIPLSPAATDCIFPHQQYNANSALLQMLDYPNVSYGMKDSTWGIHVGEDSGWLFPGLAIHAIMNGIVVQIMHSASWGCLVAVQSSLRDSTLVTVYYGHLSKRINVRLGDLVRMGDNIGEIGLSFTVANGGYLAHVHLGIEEGGIDHALIKGWYSSTDKWYNPIQFISNFSVLVR
jgi:hypothetical protein